MCHNFPKITNGAIFIADAHESKERKFFNDFLLKIEKGEIKTTQLFLMGDMFDLLIGGVLFSQDMWKEHIARIDNIAKDIEVYYFEGNHDFNLSAVFLHVKAIPISEQPFYVKSPFGLVALSHGDNHEVFSYKLYTKILRNSFSLSVLNCLDKFLKNKITKNISAALEKKQLFIKIENFQDIIKNKISKFNSENLIYIAEGHYHQDVTFKFGDIEYINFAPLSYKGTFYQISLDKRVKFIKLIYKTN